MRALRSVVLPLPVPPLTRIFRRVCNTRSGSQVDVEQIGSSTTR